MAHGFFNRQHASTQYHVCQDVLTKYNITVLQHPSYLTWPHMIFFLFPKIKSVLKAARFESIDAVKAKAMELMYKLSEDDLQHCFQQWKIRMEWCKDRGGEYNEVDIYIV
jgi:hypothetical protein